MIEAAEVTIRTIRELRRAFCAGDLRLGAMLWWPSERGRPQVLRQPLGQARFAGLDALVVSEEVFDGR